MLLIEKSFKDRKEKILEFINSEQFVVMKRNELAFVLEVPKEEEDTFQEIINELFEENKIFISKKGKISSFKKANIILGTFLGTTRGFGFVAQEDESIREVFIPFSSVNGAMHKDKVLVKVTESGGKLRKDEGIIIKIIERGTETIVGTFFSRYGNDFVIPNNKKISEYIRIKPKDRNGALSGQKVSCVVTKELKPEDDFLYGKITEVFGFIEEPGVDIQTIIAELEIPTVFGEDVLAQIESIPNVVLENEIEGRTDFRNLKIITIDGDDTKDVDDAISLEILENGNFKLGVHIADVTHYVKEGSPLDKEAFKRGTSVYLIDTVIPMLPYKLSNGICSLNENVDRLSLSCMMEINKNGVVVDHQIVNGILNVSKKTTYTIVNDLIVNQNSELLDEYKDYMELFTNMNSLSTILRNKRVLRGAIDFDFPEAKIILDENGLPIDIELRERNIATGIIEEFMLLCNETISESYFWLDIPFVYRNHEEPDAEKMSLLTDFISQFGFNLKGSGQHPKNIQRLISKIKDTAEESIISRMILRSLKQARYSHENIGHFGLAAKYYSHFTSPIRRYPDLQIHRIIKENISKNLSEARKLHYANILPEVALKCSKTERRAEEAEREVDAQKKVIFMQDKIGQVFEARITSVTSWGYYVTLPNTVEGLAKTNEYGDDDFVYDGKSIKMIDEKRIKKYFLGDKVLVELRKADSNERKLEFIIIYKD